jgi:galacturonosyltransferase
MNQDKRILILSNSWVGLYSFRKEVFQTFREEGYDVIISCPKDEPNKANWFKKIGCRIIDTQFNRKGKNPFKDIFLLIRYKELLKKIMPDVVLSYTIKPNLYGGMACQLCKVPQIANITGLGASVENPGRLQWLTILLYKIGLRKTDLVFFQNEANKQFCLDHQMVKGKYRLIPGSGVNTDYHSLQNYPAEIEPIKFVFISRLIKEKGIEEYFAAAEVIRKKYPTTEFHIVGWCEDAYSEKLKELQDEGVIVYHGPVGDVRPMIGMANCTVHPSFYPEGMSNVLLESCAAGRPIITTDRPGCGEIVDDGVNGFVVKQQDSNDLIEKIERFINLPYEQKKQMGLNARKKVEREFDRQIVIDAYLNEINRINKA